MRNICTCGVRKMVWPPLLLFMLIQYQTRGYILFFVVLFLVGICIKSDVWPTADTRGCIRWRKTTQHLCGRHLPLRFFSKGINSNPFIHFIIVLLTVLLYLFLHSQCRQRMLEIQSHFSHNYTYFHHTIQIPYNNSFCERESFHHNCTYNTQKHVHR